MSRDTYLNLSSSEVTVSLIGGWLMADFFTNQINKISIGDQLSTGGFVYGIVKILKNSLGNNEDNNLYHLLVTNKYFETIDNLESDYNNIVDSIIESTKNII